MKKYKLTNTNVILRDDNSSIPMDKGNRDYREYLDWIAVGNSPDPADNVEVLPSEPSLQDQIDALQKQIDALQSAQSTITDSLVSAKVMTMEQVEPMKEVLQ